MSRTIPLLVMTVLVGATALPAPAMADHGDGCETTATMSCGDSWLIPDDGIVNPLWWEQATGVSKVDSTTKMNYHAGTRSNQPAWFHLQTSDPGSGPYLVTVSVNSPQVVASIDVFKAHRDFDGTYTGDRQTPKCPQGYVGDVSPDQDEGVPSYVSKLGRLTLQSHVMVPYVDPFAEVDDIVAEVGDIVNEAPEYSPDEKLERTIAVPRDEDVVVVIDARAGSTKDISQDPDPIDEFLQVSYDIEVRDGTFDPTRIQDPQGPVDVDTWNGNKEDCLTTLP